MKKHITDEKNVLDYTLVNGVYLPNLISTETHYEIGHWGRRYLDYIMKHHKVFYTSLKMSCKLNSYLHEFNVRATDMYEHIVNLLKERQGITEELKVDDMIAWVQAVNNITNQAREIVSNEIINF